MYGRIACFMVRIRAGINFLMSIIKSMNLISVHFWTYLKKVVSFFSCCLQRLFFFPPQKHGIWHFTLAYIEGWTYVRTYGRSHDHVITKTSRIDGLPHFLSNGAPRARAFGACGAPLWTAMNGGIEIKWSMILAVVNAIWSWKKFRTSTGFEPVTSRYRCDALTNWAMKPLTLGAGSIAKKVFSILLQKSATDVVALLRQLWLLSSVSLQIIAEEQYKLSRKQGTGNERNP